jgi:hypothetical protein
VTVSYLINANLPIYFLESRTNLSSLIWIRTATMSAIFIKQTAPPSPPLETTLATVQVHALSAGHLTLPEQHFVSPASATARSTVPSLSFLIQHENSETGKKTRIVFDLGIRRNLERYSEPIQHHAATRRPISTSPDVVKSLAAGGLTPDDIDFVIYSHVRI